jgi:phospholipid/cholesterol/gamma-HCH transport system substrate-binding protein
MTERQTQLRIGILVLTGLLLFVGFVLSVGKRSAMFEERYSLWTTFSSTEGLTVGAPARLAGVQVGNVTRIGFGPDPRDRRIVMTLTLERRVQDRIREDSVASIGTIGLVGDKVLDITVGSHDRPVLPAGGRLASTDPPDYTRLLQKGDRILDHVTRISASLDEFLAGGETTTVGRRNLTDAMRSLRTTLVELEKGEGLLHALIYGREGTDLVARLDRAAASVERVAHAAETERGLLHALIYASPDDTLGRLGRALDGLEGLVRDVRESRGLLYALLHDPAGPEILARLGRTSERLDATVASIQEAKGLLPSLLFDPSRTVVLDDLQATLAGLKAVTGDLQAIAARLREGEGTLGALLEDPTVYEDLSALLRGANRSLLLRSLIRSTRDAGAAENP